MQIIEIQEPGQPNVIDNHQIAVGIDFGTTNSLIAISINGKVQVIKMDINHQELLPSIIESKDDHFIIGRDQGLCSIKRLFGKTYQEILNTPTLFALIKDYIDINSNELKLNFSGKLISIMEAAAEIFKYLKHQAEKALSTKITKVVVTVPAHFNDSARGEILLATKIAGLEVLRLIAEPTAAAYAYGLNKKQDGCYLIYDLGGGTFDVSILNMQQGIFQVIATNGDNMLGGDDIDQIIAKYFSDKFKLPIAEHSLKWAKEAKEILSFKNNFNKNNISLNRITFDQLISPLIDRTIKIVEDILNETNNIKIDGIVLVGGTTRIPLITNKLKEKFSINIFSDIDPDKAVVFGAALQAENLTSTNLNSLLIDVLPLSLAMELQGGIVEKIITRNTPLPIAVTQEFTNYADNQTGIWFHILQGEREMAIDCRSLARFEINKLPPMKAGSMRIEVTFAIDTDGILSVSALEKTTAKSQVIEIKPTYGLSTKDIQKLLDQAYQNAENDHITKLLYEEIVSAESLINNIKNVIKENPELLSKNEKLQIFQVINNLQNAIITKDRNLIINCTKVFQMEIKNYITKKLNVTIKDLLKDKNINQI